MEKGYRYDVVDAVLAAQSNNPAGAAEAVKQLTAWVARKDWNTLLPAYARCVRILRAQSTDAGSLTVNESLFVDPAEKALYVAVQSAIGNQQSAIPGRPASVDEFLAIIEKLVASIDTFFDKVLVMADDQALRENRLALVYRLASLEEGIADLSKLEGF